MRDEILLEKIVVNPTHCAERCDNAVCSGKAGAVAGEFAKNSRTGKSGSENFLMIQWQEVKSKNVLPIKRNKLKRQK